MESLSTGTAPLKELFTSISRTGKRPYCSIDLAAFGIRKNQAAFQKVESI